MRTMGKIIAVTMVACMFFASCKNKDTTKETTPDSIKEIPRGTAPIQNTVDKEENTENDDYSPNVRVITIEEYKREHPEDPNAADFLRRKYVNSPDGLRIRVSPSLDSSVLGSLLYGEEITVQNKSEEPITIDGITDYWYKAHFPGINGKYYNGYAWIFGGYLSDSLPSDLPIVMGKWVNKDDNKFGYHFRPDYIYELGREGSEVFDTRRWEFNGNTLTLIKEYNMGGDMDPYYEKLDKPIIDKINVTIIDNKNITLKFPDGKQVNLLKR